MSVPGRSAYQLRTTGVPATALAELIPAAHLNGEVVDVAEVSERDLVAHFTRLSHRQFSVDLGMYPLGSCTMKYNPKFCDAVANDPGLNSVHPGAPASSPRVGWRSLATLEEKLCAITGMAAATLQPAAGRRGRVDRPVVDARLSQRQRRRPPTGHRSPTRPTARTRRR